MTLAAVTLGLEDYAVIGGMMVAANMVVLAYVRSLSARVDRVENRVAAVEKGKTEKYEWARETLLARGKLERLGNQMERVDAKLDANFGVAASVGRLADELAKRRETGGG